MSTQLIQIVQFAALGAGAQASLPHNINVNGRALIPDFAARDNADFTIDAVTDALVTVTNTSGAPADCNVFLEFKQTTQRWFGAKQVQALSPQPFIPAAGGSGGAAAVEHDESLAGDGSLATPLEVVVAGLNGAGTGLDPLYPVGVFRPTEQTVIFSDMTDYGNVQFYTDNLAAGGQASNSTSFVSDNPTDGAVGEWGLNLTSLFDAYATVLLGANRQPNAYATFSQGPTGLQNATYWDLGNYTTSVFDARVKDDGVAPIVNNDFFLPIGWCNSVHPSAGAFGAYFQASFSANGDSNWHARAVSGILNGDVDTGVAVGDGVYHRFTIVWDGSTDTFTYYIDGVQVAQIVAANYSVKTLPGVVSVFNAVNGAEGQRNVLIDWIYASATVDRS